MFASTRWVGSCATWCATQATIHSFRTVSALSLRDSRPGADASGQVWATASSANSRKAAAADRAEVRYLSQSESRNAVSNVGMRRLCAISILIALSACSSAKPPAVVPNPRVAERLADADRLVRAGCLDCLVAAYGEYD